jgi:hypothetical protein
MSGRSTKTGNVLSATESKGNREIQLRSDIIWSGNQILRETITEPERRFFPEVRLRNGQKESLKAMP